jgi:hypothetical protein
MTSKTVIFVPDRKISETILEFAEPILEPLGSVPDLEAARRALDLAVGVWNFHAMATPLWGKPQFLAEARARMAAPGNPPELARIFEQLLERRATLYGGDYRVVGTWDLGPDGAGGHSFRCDARLPEGCEAYVPPAVETRIRIGGRFLDEVKIRQSKTSLLSFPVSHHSATNAGERVTIETPVLVAVQLFADGTLPAIRAGSVDVAVYGSPSRKMGLVEIHTSAKPIRGELVSLVFEPVETS